MNTESIKLNIKLDKPVYLDENTVEIGYSINGRKMLKSLKACNDGQGWCIAK